MARTIREVSNQAQKTRHPQCDQIICRLLQLSSKMKLLLDTHAFLWWITDDPQLSAKARELIGDNLNTLYWSAASSWEVAIKYALGRLPLPEPPKRFLPAELGKNRIESLPVIDDHAFQAGLLPHHHRDPFDRMLVAQSQVESLALLSNDHQLSLYDVTIHW